MTEPMKVIVITGTPASGKTTMADKVAKRIGDAEVIHANDVVRSKRLFTAYARDGAMLAQMGRLKKELEKRIRSSKKSVFGGGGRGRERSFGGRDFRHSRGGGHGGFEHGNGGRRDDRRERGRHERRERGSRVYYLGGGSGSDSRAR